MSRQLLQFGAFELDSAAGELRKHGIKIKLQEQPLQILQKLLERPGEVITREELRKHIWPVDTFVDFDHGLYSAVQRLRDALGDTAETPRYVETLPRRGYRFIGEVTQPRPVVPDDGPARGLEISPPQRSLEEIRPPIGSRVFASRVGIGAAFLAVLLGLFGFNLGGARDRVFRRTNTEAIRSLAVMPFQNISSDPSQEYFAEGITEELITTLSQITSLRVISHTSVMPYKKTTKSLPQIARELGVNGVIEGSVRREGDRVRVSVQLIQADEDKNIWTQNYERRPEDLLSLQSAIADSVLRELNVRLNPLESARIRGSRPTLASASSKAVNAFRAATYLLETAANEELFEGGEKAAQKDLKTAIGFYEQAIEEDPAYAAAYAGLAQSLTLRNGIPELRDVPRARASAWKAVNLDNALPAGHIEVARQLRLFDGSWAGAEKELRAAVQASPNSAEAHAAYAEFLDQSGRFDEGWKEQQLRQQLEPNHGALAYAFFLRHRFEEALKENANALQDLPGDGWAMLYRGIFYERAGMKQQAIMQWIDVMNYAEARDCEHALRRAYATSGYDAALRAWAKCIDTTEQRKWWPRDVLAYVYALVGDKDRAVMTIGKAIREKDDCVLDLKVSPLWDSLRTDARFLRLVSRAGFDDVVNSTSYPSSLLDTYH